MTVTIKDIAKILNVSHTTVSRALNNSPLISDETKKRILETAKQLNYVPNYSAKSLVQNRSYNIGLFFSTITQVTSPGFFYETVRGVHSVITDNYNLVVNGIDNYKDFQSIDTKRFDGIILMSQSEKDNALVYHALDRHIPIVVLNREIADAGIVNILSADRRGAYHAVTHLIENGHVKIAIIEGEKGFQATTERKEGFLTALIDKQIPIHGDYIVEGNYTMESGYTAMKQLLRTSHPPTAVFSFNDEMAVGAMKAIFEAGLRIPQDISLVGFDDRQFSSYMTPSLTTVRRAISEVGRAGAKKLLSIIDNNDYVGQKVYIDTQFIRRESVGPAPNEQSK
ncbi:LacI family DNA-binding transcriptional regulator [Alicyclobacillus mengziensis]|uniref:LacI family DNA-binding transcriptional regulator n=1 Tax=Alicyclobacillus mengziensis TaxID=2931921 RepID=A0A9X7VWY8_9BACL|nr:LacI family DNA-binding transcriptional regulator [Alicyclobacillus mengziensis]QSO46611.1 LacI family DNA-binding transcriptional regulator [Alicyclobacillus mengziensis]